jgi:hypothetical protein
VADSGEVEGHRAADQQHREHRAAQRRTATRAGLGREQRDGQHQRVERRAGRPQVQHAAQQHQADDHHRHHEGRTWRQQQREREQCREQHRRRRLGVAGFDRGVPQDRRLEDAPGDERGDAAADQQPAPAAGR